MTPSAKRTGAWLLKFAGLGGYGRAKLARAERLAKAGFAPPSTGLTSGFLISEFIIGTPLTTADVDQALLDTLARYLAFLRHTFPVEGGVSLDSLLEMVTINTTEALGDACVGELARLERLRPYLECAQAVALDGRMLPHEWLRTPRGFLKTDALDHHDDHFFPGCQDIAWDLAATYVEFALTLEAQCYLVERYRALAGDDSIHERLPFYRVAYLASRLGYATLAADTLGATADAARWRVLARRYSFQIKAALAAIDPDPLKTIG